MRVAVAWTTDEPLTGCEDEHACAADREGPVRRVGVDAMTGASA